MSQLRATIKQSALAAALAMAALPALAQDVAVEAAVSASAATEAELAPLPELDPAQWFDGRFGGTFGGKTVSALPKSKRVAVAGFRLVFVNHNEARAMVRASYLPGRDTTGAKAKMIVELEGVDTATLQAITDAAYARFIEQIKATGREVVPVAEMANFFAEVKAQPTPMEGSFMLSKGLAFAPTGMPLWFGAQDVWGKGGGFGGGNDVPFAKLSVALGAPITIAPLIVVDFAQMQSSGNRSGLIARRAEVGATLSMSIPMFTTRVVRAEEVRGWGVQKGDDGGLAMTGTLDTDIEFATLIEAPKEKNEGLTNAIRFIGGLGPSNKSVKKAVTTNAAYSTAAEAVLTQATGTFAKLFAQHPAP